MIASWSKQRMVVYWEYAYIRIIGLFQSKISEYKSNGIDHTRIKRW